MRDQLSMLSAIRDRKAKYCRFVDTKRWDDLADILIANPKLRFYATDGSLIFGFDSTAEWIDLMKSYLDGAHTIHQIHNEEFEVVSDTEIRAIWSMEDYLKLAEGPDRPASMHGFGHYHETWRLEDGKWRIAKIDLRRTILEITPRP